MKRKLFPLIVLMFFALTSCQRADPMSRIEIEDFRNKDGEYVFRDSRWGMTKTELEKALGTKIVDEAYLNIEEAQQPPNYMSRIDAVIFGRNEKDCMLVYVFADDEFNCLAYSIRGESEDMRQFYDESVEKITKAFGEPTEAYEFHSVNGENARWINTYESGEKNIFSVVFIINEQKGNASVTVQIGAWTPPE